MCKKILSAISRWRQLQVLFIFANFLSISSFAKNQCVRVVYSDKGKDLPTEKLERVSVLLNSVMDSLLTPENKPAREIEVHLTDVADHGIARPGIRVIKYGFQDFNIITQEPQSTENSLPLLVHELGHLIFDLLMSNRFDWWKKMSEALEERGEISSAMQMAISKLAATIDPKQFENKSDFMSEMERRKASDSEIRELMGRYALLNIYLKGKVKKRYELTNPYNEFFADVFSILFYENGMAIAQGLSYPQTEKYDALCEFDKACFLQANKSAGFRDFTVDHPLDKWNETEMHILLSPSRSFLWRKITDSSEKFRNKKELLLKIFNAIAEEIDQRVGLDGNLSPEAINKQLIQRLSLLVP